MASHIIKDLGEVYQIVTQKNLPPFLLLAVMVLSWIFQEKLQSFMDKWAYLPCFFLLLGEKS